MNAPVPPEPSDAAVDVEYRRARDTLPAGPSAPVRAAILAHAHEVAAARRPAPPPPSEVRRAANDSVWRRSAIAGIAVAALAVLLWLPYYRSAHGPGPIAPQVEVASAPAPAAAAPERTPRTEAKAPAPAARSAEPAAERIAASPPPAAAEPPRAAPAERPVADRRSAANAANAAAASTAEVTAQMPARREALAVAKAADAAAPSAPAAAGALGEPRPAPASAADAAGVDAGTAERSRRLVGDASLEARDRDGRTALMRAVLDGRLDRVRQLLAAGADANAADSLGRRPLGVARAAGATEIAALLEANGGR